MDLEFIQRVAKMTGREYGLRPSNSNSDCETPRSMKFTFDLVCKAKRDRSKIKV